MITDRALAQRPALGEAADLLVLDDPDTARRIAGHDGRPVTDAERTCPLLPSHAAYIVHTSGSTGRPKGVLVQHTGVAAMLSSTAVQSRIVPGSRVLQFASLAFDAALYEMFETLCSGSTLVVASPERLLPGRGLERLAHEERITTVTLWLVLLGWYTGQDEVAVLADTPHGPVAVRADLSDEPGFTALRARLHRTPAEPFVPEAGPLPVRYAGNSTTADGHGAELSLSWSRSDAGLTLVIGYAPELFDESTVLTMATDLTRLLSGLTDCPEASVQEVALDHIIQDNRSDDLAMLEEAAR